MQTQAIERRTTTTAAPAATTTTTTRPSPRRWNPAEYKADFKDLIAVNPGLAAESATKLATIKRDQERQLNAAEDATSDLIALLGATGIVAIVGLLDGMTMAKREAIIQGWEANGLVQPGEEPPGSMWKEQKVREPGKLWIMPIDLLIPIGFGVGAVIAAASRDEDVPASTLERWLSVTATSTLGLFIASLTRPVGARWQERRMLSAATQTSDTGT